MRPRSFARLGLLWVKGGGRGDIRRWSAYCQKADLFWCRRQGRLSANGLMTPLGDQAAPVRRHVERVDCLRPRGANVEDGEARLE